MHRRFLLLTGGALLAACHPRPAPKAPALSETRKAADVAPGGLISEVSVSPYPDASSVRLFVRIGDGPGQRRYFEPDGRLLTSDQRRSVERTILKRVFAPVGDDAARGAFACCVPHHFFRYFNQHQKQVGEVAICFCCSCIETDPPLPIAAPEELGFDYKKIKSLIAAMGLPTDVDCEA